MIKRDAAFLRMKAAVADVIGLSGYTAKELPQPQAFVALGFWKTNPLPLRPSEKSSWVPARKM